MRSSGEGTFEFAHVGEEGLAVLLQVAIHAVDLVVLARELVLRGLVLRAELPPLLPEPRKARRAGFGPLESAGSTLNYKKLYRNHPQIERYS